MLTPEQQAEIALADKYNEGGNGVQKPRCLCGTKLKHGQKKCITCANLESNATRLSKKDVGLKEKGIQGVNTHKDWSFYVDDMGPTHAVGDSLKILEQMLSKL